MANKSNYFPRRSSHFKNYRVILSGRGSPIEDYKNFSTLFDETICETTFIKNCVEKRTTLGGPGKNSILAHIEFLDNFILEAEKFVNEFKLNDIL